MFVNAISSVRRLAAILKLLGLPAQALHAGEAATAACKGAGTAGQRLAALPCRCAAACKPLGSPLQPPSITQEPPLPSWRAVVFPPPRPCPLHPAPSTGMQQRQRLKALDRFRAEANAVLVATDVAARGLDIKDVR